LQSLSFLRQDALLHQGGASRSPADEAIRRDDRRSRRCKAKAGAAFRDSLRLRTELWKTRVPPQDPDSPRTPLRGDFACLCQKTHSAVMLKPYLGDVASIQLRDLTWPATAATSLRAILLFAGRFQQMLL